MFSISKVLRQVADKVDETSEARKKIMSDICTSVGEVAGTVTRVATSSVEGLKDGFNKGIQGGNHESQVRKICTPCPDSCGTSTPETCPIIKAQEK